jgi:hypothetical protein
MAKYNAFLDIVRERHDPKIHRDKLVCPYCNSKKVKNNGTGTTLVGGYNNHLTTHCECKKCHKTFTLQVKELGKRNKYISWYVSNDRKILKGIPGCYKGYIYTCNKCGGEVIREYLDEYSDNHVQILSSGSDKNGVWQNHYRIFFRCKSCGVKIQSENDHYWPNPPKEMSYEEKVKEAKKQNRKKLRTGWKIFEELGICIINDYAVAKVTTDK